MSKRAKNLLIIGIFILSMAVVLLILVLTQPKDSADGEESQSSTISVLSYDRDSIAEMTIKNENGEFTIRNAVAGFTIDDYAEFRQNSTVMGAAGRCVTAINAQALVEEHAADLEKYGLADGSPKAECDVTLKDGTKYSVYFGIDSPEGNTRYMRLADSDSVYTVLSNSSGYFYYRPEDFLSLSVTEELTNNNTAPTIDHLVITRRDFDFDVEFIDDSKNHSIDDVGAASSQVMISPVYAYLDITNSNAIIYGIWGLTAMNVAVVRPTEAQLEEYGIADPFCEVNLDAELQNYNLKIGNVASYELDQNGEPTTNPASYYCYYNGIDIIYEFAVSEIPYVSFQPIDILSSSMTSNYIYKLDYIDVEFSGDNPAHYNMNLTGNPEEQTLSAIIDGNEVDAEEFKQLYIFMLKCPIDDLCFEDPGDSPLICRIDFRNDDGSGDILEFYDTGANRVTIKLNGTTSFSQPKGYLKVLQENIEAFKNGASGDELKQVW